MQIKKNYCPLKDLVSVQSLIDTGYNLGDELSEFLKANKKLQHISLFDSSQKGLLYFDLNAKIKSGKRPTQRLIYISSFTPDKQKQINKLKPNDRFFCFLSRNHQDKFETTKEFNFSQVFKKSNLNNWEIIIEDAGQIKLNCIVLNTFLARGARVTFSKTDEKFIKNKFKIVKMMALSLQHEIIFYVAKNQ